MTLLDHLYFEQLWCVLISISDERQSKVIVIMCGVELLFESVTFKESGVYM